MSSINEEHLIISASFLAEPHKQPIYEKQKETNELIFSWLWWLAVLIVGAYTRRRRRSMADILQITCWQRHAALVYCVLLWYWTAMLWSTFTCQNKVSADQYHVTISRAQVNTSSRTRFFLKLTADKVLVFRSLAHVWLTCWKQGRIVREAG